MADVKVIAISKEELDIAYSNLLLMAEHFPDLLKTANHNGRGAQSAKACRAVLITGAKACLTLSSMVSKEQKQ